MIRHLLILAVGLATAACASHRDAGYERPAPGYGGVPASARTGTDSPGWQRMAEGDPRAAQADFDSALQINPFDPIALNNAAVAKSENGQTHEAVALLERANRLAPENAEIAANLSRLRSYASSYALQGSDTGGPDSVIETATASTAASSGLPPPPPPLWSPSVRAQTAAGQPNAGYYDSGCAPDPARGSAKSKRKSRAAAVDCR